MNEDHGNEAHWDAVEPATELLQEARFEEALFALRDVARADPRNPYVYYFMGIALFELGKLEEARDAYRAAVRLAPGYLGARVGLAHVLRMLNDARSAVREAEAALAHAPGDPDAMHALGLAHAAGGDRSKAREYLEAFLKTNPEFETMVEVREVLAELGNVTKLRS